MRDFLRYLYVVAAMLMVVVGDVWAEWPTYSGTTSISTGYVLDASKEEKININAEKEYALSGPGATLQFDARKGGYTTGPLRIDQYVDGVWKNGVLSIGNGSLSSSSFNPFSCTLNPRATKVRFYNEGSLNKVFKNVKVTLASYVGKTNLPSWTANTAMIGAADETTSVKLDWSNTSALTYTITGTGASQFSCAITNNASAGKYGTATLTITYKHKEVKTHSATLELSNGEKIPLTGTTLKKNQTISWAPDFKDDKVSLPAGKEIISPATVNTGLPLTYTSSNEAILAVDGTTIKALQAGEVTLTVEQAGNDEWNPVSATKTIKVTEKIIQYIHWIDNLTRLKVGGEPVQLTATAEILRNAETGETIDAPERTALIKYQSADENVVTINGSELIIVGEGTTTVTASLPGDDIYEATSISMPVRVRVPSTTCETYVLDAPEEHKYAAATAGSYEPVEFNGPGHILTFQARSSNKNRVGPIIYEQYVNGEWKKLDNGNPNTDWRDYWYELDRNATKVRFRNEVGSYERHFKNVLVTQATYLETTTPEITVEKSVVGDEIQRNLIVQYSNIPAGAIITNTSDDIMVSIDELDSDCGKYGEQIITIKTIPFEVGTMEDVVTIHEEVTGLTLNIPIKIHTQKAEQHLYWDAPTQPITSCSDLQLPISTTEGLAINWSVEGSDCAELDVNGNLLIYATGEITLEATNEGNAIYAPFSQTYTIPVAYNPIFFGTEDDDWNNPNNWNVCHLPSETDVVIMHASAVLEEHVTIGGLVFNNGGSMQILSKGGLTVGVNGITGAKEDGSTITIDNTPQGAGFLRVDPTTDNKPAKVTVNYTTEAYNSGNPRDEVWQYMGAPGSEIQMSDADKTMIYHWDEVKGWVKQSGVALSPFVGYAFTQNKALSANFTIMATPIIPEDEDIQEINLTVTPSGMGGSNLFVNSFLAPIDLATFTGDEFEGDVVQTFYLFNSGSWTQWQNQGGKDHMEYGTSPGQYFALTPGSAALVDASLDQTTIPPMQGVYVVAEGNGGKIKLDYMKHVYNANASNRPMRAPQRTSEDLKRVRLQVNSENSGADRMYVIQHNECTAGYDNGYDAENIAVDGQVSIYTDERAGQMEISVSDHIDSTYIGFQAGSDSEYQLRITSIIGEELYLKDLENDVVMTLVDDEVYTFSATPNTTNNRRFLLLDRSLEVEDDNGVSTDIDDVKTTNLWIADKMVYVANAPLNSELVVYNMSGLAVAKYAVGYTPCTVDLSYLSTGVYLLRLDEEAYKMVCK